jgi:hypothetical protein
VIESHVYDRVRHFLARRHKVPARGTRGFSIEAVYGSLGSCVLDTAVLALSLWACNEAGRKAGCGKSARPV